MAAAWTNIPAVISCLRPTRSDHHPVSSCPAPHTAGYSAASAPIRATDSPCAAKSSGNTPQASASLRLLTIPAQDAADSALSPADVRQAIARVVAGAAKPASADTGRADTETADTRRAA